MELIYGWIWQVFIGGAALRNKVHPTTVMKLLWDFAYVPKA